MQSLEGFFSAVERALFEVITWVILIPKTLYRSIAFSAETADYVKAQVAEEARDRFREVISPVFLYLFVALGPFFLMQLVELERLPIVGAAGEAPADANFFRGVVDSTLSLQLSLADLRFGEDAAIRWQISEDIKGIVPGDSTDASSQGGSQVDDTCRDAMVDEYFALDSVLMIYDCSDAEAEGLEEAFERLVVSLYDSAAADEKGLVASKVREIVAERYGEEAAHDYYDFWCSPPAYLGCEPESATPAESTQSALAPGSIYDVFSEFTEEYGQSADAARAAASLTHGEAAAARAVVVWCAEPADEGCLGSHVEEVWSGFQNALASTGRADAARDSVSAQTADSTLATAILEFWCSPPADVGCGPEPSALVDLASADLLEGDGDDDARLVDAFLEYVDGGYSAAVARDFLFELTDSATAHEVLDWWCSPPAGEGCAAADDPTPTPDDYTDLYASSQRAMAEASLGFFIDSLDIPVDSAVTLVMADDHDSALVADIADSWCVGAGAAGCDAPSPVACELDRPWIRCTWTTEGAYRLSAAVLDHESGEVLDVSEQYLVSIDPNPEERNEARKKRFVEEGAGPEPTLQDLVKSSTTMLEAIGLLMLPLGLALMTVLFRSTLTPTSLRPAFYVQCLFLAPLALVIWIPLVVDYYSPNPHTGLRLASAALLVMLLAWLFFAEVAFVASEREVSTRRATSIVLLTGLIAGPAVVAALGGELVIESLGLTKFEMIEGIGYAALLLMALPFLGKIATRWGARSA